MKIHTLVVIDLKSGRTLKDESHEYQGPIALLKGKAPKIVTPGPSPEEIAAIRRRQAIEDFQLRREGLAFETDPTTGALRVRRLAASEREPTSEEDRMEEEINKLVLQKVRASLGDPLGLTPEARAKIGEVFTSQRTLGERSIDRYARELAGSRGMSLSDSPVASAALGARTDLETALRGAESGSLLSGGLQMQQFHEAQRQFQEGLRQQAILNRMGIASLEGQHANVLANTRRSFLSPGSSGGFNFGAGLGNFFGSALGTFLRPNPAPSP